MQRFSDFRRYLCAKQFNTTHDLIMWHVAHTDVQQKAVQFKQRLLVQNFIRYLSGAADQ